MFQTCTKCGVEKAVEAFPVARRSKRGRDTRCKACAALATKEYVKKYPEKAKEAVRKAWKKYGSRYTKHGDPVKRKARAKAWQQAHPEERAEHRKRWRDNNMEKALEIERASREKYRGKALERQRRYLKAHPGKGAAHTRKRNAAKLRALPLWANLAAIEAIYAQCAIVTELTGVSHHVDHIVPLQSPIVCGLHIAHNLQVLDGSANRRKHNKLMEV